MTAPDLISLIDPRVERPGALLGLRPEPVPVSAIRRVSLTRRLTLRLSLWLGYRRQRIIREARSEASRRGWQTQRAKAPPSPFDLPADDWDQCPKCNFILVACDCDASQGEKH